MIAEMARSVEFFQVRSGWFDCTKLYRYVQGAYALDQGSWSALNLLEPHDCRDSKVCRVMSLGWFDCTKPSPSTSLRGKLGVMILILLKYQWKLMVKDNFYVKATLEVLEVGLEVPEVDCKWISSTYNALIVLLIHFLLISTSNSLPVDF